MSYQTIPLTSDPNQTLEVSVTVDEEIVNLSLFVRYNEIAEYWTMKVSDQETGEVLIDSVPFLMGEDDAANILGQHEYLGIGSAYVVPITQVDTDRPDGANLGTEFVLLWGDSE